MNNKHYRRHREMDDFDAGFVKNRPSKHNKYNELKKEEPKHKRVMFDSHDFKCAECGFFVSAKREFSGVNNRNHCPRCLWSLHVDQHKPGDRLSQCKSRMRPIGLTFKHTYKHYECENQGELMLIHQCTGCGKLSINRIASDDDTMQLYKLFLQSTGLNPIIRQQLEMEKIILLTSHDLTSVHSQLFGTQSLLNEFVDHKQVFSHQKEQVEPKNYL